MESSSPKFIVIHGTAMGEWENSQPGILTWSDEDDGIIDQSHGPRNRKSFFKLQTKSLSSSVRIILRDYMNSTQVTVIEGCSSRDDARLGYQYLVEVVLTETDFADPRTVREALVRRTTMPGYRIQLLVNLEASLFPDPILRLVKGPMHFDADIIVVHGLGSSSRTTWTNEAGEWPITWLLDPNVGIHRMLAQYGIRNLPSLSKLRVLSICQQGGIFDNDVESDPHYMVGLLVGLLFNAGVGSKPIIWIAYSLGGLIVKEILSFAHENATRHDIYNSTKGVVFFGTPHCGAPSLSALRQQNTAMHNSSVLIYLDPAPDNIEEAGNGPHLQALNQFLSQTDVPFLNFSEGNVCPALASLTNVIIVPDEQAQIPESGCVEPVALAEAMAIGVLPPRVHYPCPDRHHLNIMKPPTQAHPTYRLTRTYVANWLQLRPRIAFVPPPEIVNFDCFVRNIMGTVRMYGIAIQQITEPRRIQTLIPVAAVIASTLEFMTMNQLATDILCDSQLADAVGMIARVYERGALRAAMTVAQVMAENRSRRNRIAHLPPNIQQSLLNNFVTARAMVNFVRSFVLPDFHDALVNAQSRQELDATLNYLQRAAAQIICCVFLDSPNGEIMFCNHHAIQVAVGSHTKIILRAEAAVAQLSQALGGATLIMTNENEQRARAILTPEFIRRAHQGFHDYLL